ncbi:unnamed protein product [Phytomonas sp. Hart1]|nr:unnamed protein product [Phytomonas sp. Hart1]|eukprot:CCW71711.1 unnamed protein product [Phytomonas sp. isolate Hart1]
MLGLREVRLLQTVLHPTRRNYVLDVGAVKRRIIEDHAGGFVPFLVVGLFGGGLSGAVDPLPALADFCARIGVWFHIDASHGAAALISAIPQANVSSSSPFLNGGEDEMAFREAAERADSIYVDGESVGLPFSLFSSLVGGMAPLSGWGALLYVANTAKVQCALREAEMGTSPHNSFLPTGQGGGESVLTASMLRLPPLEVISLGYGLVEEDQARGGLGSSLGGLPRRVRRQQGLMGRLQLHLLTDGRFDAPFRSAGFGLLLFRWLLQDDEATRRLAAVWHDVLTDRDVGPVRVYLCLVVLQKRVWLQIHLSEPPLLATENEEEKGFADDPDEGARSAEAYVMSTLQEAVARMDNERFGDSPAGEAPLRTKG